MAGMAWLLARRDLCAGLLMLAIGVSAALAATQYDLGTLRRMGPGFFPMSLGVILAVVGGLIVATARKADASGATSVSADWRGWGCICASIVAFVVLGRYGGLVPATFATVFIAALADRDNSVRAAAVLAALMTAICVLIFWYLLKIAFPLIRWGA